MIITHYIQADLSTAEQNFPPIRVMQGDHETQAVSITLKEGADLFQIPQGTAAVVRFRRLDGTGGVYDTLPDGEAACSVGIDTVTVMLAPAITAQWGSVTVSVALILEEQILGIVPFSVCVIADPAAGVTAAEDYFNYSVLQRVDAALRSKLLPAYWQEHFEEKVEQIRNATEGVGRNRSAFFWYNDTHWDTNPGITGRLLEALSRKTPIRKTFFGGGAMDGGSSDWASLHRWQEAMVGVPNHHSVAGDDDRVIPNDRLYAMMMAPEEHATIVRGGDFSYYMDDPNEQTRYLFLDTGSYTSHNAPVNNTDFLLVLQALQTVPDGWHIVAIGHIWFLPTDSSDPTVGQIPMSCQLYLQLFDALNTGRSGSYVLDGRTYTYDFSDSRARVEFCIGGHAYTDHCFLSAGDIPVILTEADNPDYSMLNGTPGTISESSVSAIVADYRQRILHIIRVGRGENWRISL